MNTIVWILQGLLAVMFTFSGVLILVQSKEKLADKMPFVNDYSPSMVKLIAIVIQDGNLITGQQQNPSAAAAELLIRSLNK